MCLAGQRLFDSAFRKGSSPGVLSSALTSLNLMPTSWRSRILRGHAFECKYPGISADTHDDTREYRDAESQQSRTHKDGSNLSLKCLTLSQVVEWEGIDLLDACMRLRLDCFKSVPITAARSRC